MRARNGFTLLEITIASAVLMLVIVASMNSFMGMRKAQNSSLVYSQMQSAGNKTLRDVYLDLSQAKMIVASESASSTVTPDYFSRFELLPSPAPQPVPAGNRKYPVKRPDGGLGLRGTGIGELAPTSVGNMIVLVKPDEPYVIDTSGVRFKDAGGAGWVNASDRPFRLNTQRFVAYYVVEKRLPPGQTVRGGRNYTYQLARWESRRYLEHAEVDALRGIIHVSSGAGDLTTMRNEIVTELGNNCIWKSDQANPTVAFFNVPTFSIVSGLVNASWGSPLSTPVVGVNVQTYAVNAYADAQGLTMLSFNTVPASDDYPVAGLSVPLYAEYDSAAPEIPYGFEVAIAGPIGARSVLTRLALVGKIHGGSNSYVSAPQQQVVKVFDTSNF